MINKDKISFFNAAVSSLIEDFKEFALLVEGKTATPKQIAFLHKWGKLFKDEQRGTPTDFVVKKEEKINKKTGQKEEILHSVGTVNRPSTAEVEAAFGRGTPETAKILSVFSKGIPKGLEDTGVAISNELATQTIARGEPKKPHPGVSTQMGAVISSGLPPSGANFEVSQRGFNPPEKEIVTARGMSIAGHRELKDLETSKKALPREVKLLGNELEVQRRKEELAAVQAERQRVAQTGAGERLLGTMGVGLSPAEPVAAVAPEPPAPTTKPKRTRKKKEPLNASYQEIIANYLLEAQRLPYNQTPWRGSKAEPQAKTAVGRREATAARNVSYGAPTSGAEASKVASAVGLDLDIPENPEKERVLAGQKHQEAVKSGLITPSELVSQYTKSQGKRSKYVDLHGLAKHMGYAGKFDTRRAQHSVLERTTHEFLSKYRPKDVGNFGIIFDPEAPVGFVPHTHLETLPPRGMSQPKNIHGKEFAKGTRPTVINFGNIDVEDPKQIAQAVTRVFSGMQMEPMEAAAKVASRGTFTPSRAAKAQKALTAQEQSNVSSLPNLVGEFVGMFKKSAEKDFNYNVASLIRGHRKASIESAKAHKEEMSKKV